jgi:voltage-gated potassium channel
MEAAGFKLKIYFGLLLATMVLGTVSISTVENLSVLDAFYFSVVTIATVGYGDIHPTTPLGKILAIGLIVAGVGTFLEVIAGITQVMIGRRDKEIRMEKLNMIVGLFFSEIGTRLLRILSAVDPNRSMLAEELSASGGWTDLQILDKADRLAQYNFSVQVDLLDMESLRQFFGTKGDLLIRLLENPSLFEHESFTELLRAIFHIRDELGNRDHLTELPASDKKHLSGDMERVYRLLASHWLTYMGYLKRNYPYLFSLAVRTNPFDNHARAVIQE